MSDELLTKAEKNELFEKYELEDPYQVSSFGDWLIDAQLAKLKLLGYKSPKEVEEAIKQEGDEWRQKCEYIVATRHEISTKEEREKIISWLAKHSYKQFANDADLHLNYHDWQALKDGQEEVK